MKSKHWWRVNGHYVSQPAVAWWLINETARRLAHRNAGQPYVDAVLLSFPRSGNHAVRALAEATTGRPTLGCDDFGLLPSHLVDRPIFLRPGTELAVRNCSPVLRKSHSPSEATTKKLIVILRDPVEAVLSHSRAETDNAFAQGKQAKVDLWLRIAETWTMWKQEDRHLIYYSDIATDSISVVNDLHRFLGFGTVYAEGNQNDLSLIQGGLQAGKAGLARPAHNSTGTYRNHFPRRAAEVQSALEHAFDDSSDEMRSLLARFISRTM